MHLAEFSARILCILPIDISPTICYTLTTVRKKERYTTIPDKRRHYVLVLDTETANTIVRDDGTLDMSDVLAYDVGWAVVDTKGHIYETKSYVNKDIFLYERDLMRTAYYAKKIPQYCNEIRAKQRILSDTYSIRADMLDTLDRYGITEVVAHNAYFDMNALNRVEAYVNKSLFRYWFPLDRVVFWDTMKMAQDVICPTPTYKQFCEKHDYFTANGKPRKTAEILYRYISGKDDFSEAHTALEDVLIEAEIMWYCMRKKKPMRKLLFEKPRENVPMTEFQKELWRSLKTTPTIFIGD